LARAPAGLRAEVDALAALVDSGRSPADDVLDTAYRSGPAGALLAACADPTPREETS
ncbi:MAG: Glutamate--cysteine ligase EgtA, partial [Klenkia sp.]|nr:Glutamate--cysteine ligase EgtA [Klenkia sp.]